MKYPKARNSDRYLLARIWENQLNGQIVNSFEFLSLLENGDLANPESIRRARQLIQREIPMLRADENIIDSREEQNQEMKTQINTI